MGKFGVSTHNSSSARVYGSEIVGNVRAADYQISGDASKHKYHRNNIEKYKLSGSGPSHEQDYDGMTVTIDSLYDNAFVSHMIPRTDQQTRWITASIN